MADLQKGYLVTPHGAKARGSFFKAEEPSRRETKAEKKAAAEAQWRAVCKAVDARDGKACRCCDKRSDPDATGLLERGHRHHIIYRSAGGKDTTDNVITLCAKCHEDEHRGRLKITNLLGDVPANADEPVLFWWDDKDPNGIVFVIREEIAVRVIRRD